MNKESATVSISTPLAAFYSLNLDPVDLTREVELFVSGNFMLFLKNLYSHLVLN